jgi:N-formylglutamate amidohydrolase
MTPWSSNHLFAGGCLLAAMFSASAAMAQVDPGKFMIVSKGRLPIILSAPHGGQDPIPGVKDRVDHGQPNFTTSRDLRTLELAQKVAAAIAMRLGQAPSTIIAKFQRKQIDTNRPPQDAYELPGTGGAKLVYDAYHRAIADARADALKAFGRGILLDIHGQGSEDAATFRGTRDGKTVTHLVKQYGQEAMRGPKSILGVLTANGYRIIPANDSNAREDPRYDGGYTVQTYGSSRGGSVDAMQLEFGTKLRATENLDKTASDVAEAVATFAKEYLPAVK